ELSLTPTEAQRHALKINLDGQRRSAYDLLAYPDIDLERLRTVWPELAALSPQVSNALEIEASYAVYLERQQADIVSFRNDEAVAIPDDFDYSTISGLSNELKLKLDKLRPANLAQAAKVEGMTPAAAAL